MSEIFPQPIINLPEANIPINGINAYLSQSDTHQIIFMEFANDVELPEHSHAAQVGFVLEGKIEMIINGANCKTKSLPVVATTKTTVITSTLGQN